MADKSAPRNPNITGGAGVVPPPDAPRQTSSVDIAPTVEQIAQARANEVDQPVFAPKALPDAVIASGLGCSVAELLEMRRTGLSLAALRASRSELMQTHAQPAQPAQETPRLVDAHGYDIRPTITQAPAGGVSSYKPVDVPLRKRLRRPGSAGAVAPPSVETAQVETVAQEPPPEPAAETGSGAPPSAIDVAPAPAELPPPLPHQKAASNTDTPSRGLPRASADPNKTITGGFGDVGEAEYFPLDGNELRTLIEALMDGLYARIQDDLRFSIAAVYPRVAARVIIEVNCHAHDQSFQIEKRLVPPHEKTPLDVARRFGDEVVFCVVAERVEMDEHGNSLHPPNATRMELDLAVPRKQFVQNGAGRMLVDRRS
jgi:hypothetical protein